MLVNRSQFLQSFGSELVFKPNPLLATLRLFMPPVMTSTAKTQRVVHVPSQCDYRSCYHMMPLKVFGCPTSLALMVSDSPTQFSCKQIVFFLQPCFDFLRAFAAHLSGSRHLQVPCILTTWQKIVSGTYSLIVLGLAFSPPYYLLYASTCQGSQMSIS